jgi:flagellar biosynthesis GTPase FlhF
MREPACTGAATREIDLRDASVAYTADAALRETPRIYRGRTVQELIPKIVAELGDDAIVVRHEKGLTGGFAGFFRRPFVEIEAQRGAPRFDRYDDEEEEYAGALPEAPQEPVPHPVDAFAAELAVAETAEPVLVEDLHTEASACPPIAAAQRELPIPAAPAPFSATPISVSSGPVRDAIERTLLGFGVEEQLVREVIQAAAAHVLPLLQNAPGPALPGAVRRALQQRIPTCPPLPPGGAMLALVGPGGSGKSACCAAMLDAYHRRSTLPAARAVLVPGAVPGTLDVALGPHLPEPVALEDPRAEQALRSAREEGLLLLDTPSLSPAEDASIHALAAALLRLAPDRVVLALPATLGAKPVARLLEAYRPLGTSALAITHADETDQLGVAVQVACALGLAPAYLLEGNGTGWELAQIEPADLADRLLPPQ